MVRAASVDRNGMRRGAWSEEEDEKLRACIHRFGHPNWRLLPLVAGLKRCGKSCRLRWVNYLKPGVKRGNFTKHEENLIIQLHKNLPNKWAAIAAKFPGRTDNDIKNYWHAHIQKRQRKRNRNKAAMMNKIQTDDDDDDDGDTTSSCITTDGPNSSSEVEVEVEVVFPQLQAEENMGATAAVSESNADSDYNKFLEEDQFHGIMEMDDIMSPLFEHPSSNCYFSDHFLPEPAVGDEDFFNFQFW